jgi:hypothetical protein
MCQNGGEKRCAIALPPMQINVDLPEEHLTGFAEVLDFLADRPSPEEILELRPSVGMQEEIDRLSKKYQAQDLSAEEQHLWQQYEYLEHVVRIAKTKAYLRLSRSICCAENQEENL